MFIFHEGNLRSGKTYEMIAKHMVPAFKKGKHVYSNIQGVKDNLPNMAGHTGIPLEIIQSHYHELTSADVRNIGNTDIQNSVIFVDEAWEYWPDVRQPLPMQMQKFIAYLGQNKNHCIVASQTFMSVHRFLRDRTDKKITFHRLDALGKQDSYKWTAYKKDVNTGKFGKINSGVEKYRPEIFPLYKSHKVEEEDNEDSDVYQDKRLNFLNTKVVKVYIPALVMLLFAGVYSFYTFFTDNTIINQAQKNNSAFAESSAKPKPKITIEKKQPAGTALTESSSPPAKPKNQYKEERQSRYAHDEKEHLRYLMDRYRARHAGVIQGENGKIMGVVEWYQGNKLYESLRLTQIRDMGYLIEHKNYGLRISREKEGYVVTQWSLNSTTRTNTPAFLGLNQFGAPRTSAQALRMPAQSALARSSKTSL